MARVCRLRNGVNDLLRWPLKDQQQLQLPTRLVPAASAIMFPCCRQTVCSAGPPTDRCHVTLPDADRVRCLWIARVCAGGGSCSESFVGATIFASGRTPSTYRPSLCTGAAQARRSGFAASAPTRLTAPQAHESVLSCEQQPYGRASRRVLQRLRRAAPGRVPCALLVSRHVLAVRAHAERCREHPRSGSSDRWSGTECPDLRGSPQIFPTDNRHGFEILTPSANFLPQEIIF